MGTYSEDMDLIARESSYVTGRTVANGGAGDSSILTAYGVYQGMRAAARHTFRRHLRAAAGSASRGSARSAAVWWNTFSRGRRGRRLATSTSSRSAGSGSEHPEVEAVADAATLKRSDIDVYAPARLGGALDDTAVAELRAKIVCGGANNQLAHPGVEKQLADRGILYAP